MKYLIGSILAAFLLLQGCTVATKRQPEKAKPTYQKTFAAAKEALKRGDQKLAKSQFELILKEAPDSEIADDAAIALGNIHFKNQNYDSALESYLRVVQSKTISPRENEAKYLGARSLYFLDRFDEATGLLEQVAASDALRSKELLKRTYKLLYRTYLQQSDYMDVLKSIDKLLSMDLSIEQKFTFRQRVQTFIENQLDWNSIKVIAANSDLENIRGYAYYALGKHYAEVRDYDQASNAYESVISFLPETNFSEEAHRFLADMEARKMVAPKTIGVILPLSGRHSRVAYRALMGIQLALGVFDDAGTPYRLAVVDSEGNPDIAARAVERLVLEDHVIAIIGSLLSRTAEAVSKTAHHFGVPSIALSQKANLTEIGNSVFRNALTSEMQVSHLVRVAMKNYGLKRFAILFPNDRYGIEYANLFWDHVLAYGGEVTAAQSYKPSETDFKGAISRLVGTFYIDDRLEEYKYRLKEWQKENINFIARKSPPEDLLPPVVDFDALFVPDGTKALAQIAPMLRYNDVSNVLLMGTNLWHSKTLMTRLGSLAENTLFVDSKLMEESQKQRSTFFRRFNETFEENPGPFEIRGFDSAFLLRSLIDSGLTNRSQVIEQLTSTKGFPGIAGPMTVTSQREISPPVASLTVRNKAFAQVSDHISETEK